ncbi:MAG: ferredoxin [Candidatus Doudnabacteria bacterium]|nr:ferredoxin [Candidatus Doudnabacteria bacterium]
MKNSPIKITQKPGQIFIRRSKNSKYIVEYHREKCTGIGICAEIAPNTFVMNTDNKADLIELPETEDTDEQILAAAQSCPALAIFIRDSETGALIFPPPELAPDA